MSAEHIVVYCITTVLISALLSGIVIPQILLIAFRKKLFDEPDARKIHFSTVPRLGGLAFVPVIFLSLAFTIGIESIYLKTNFLIDAEMSQALLFGSCVLIILYLIGIADDLVGVRYRAKFVVQVLCGIIFILGGTWMQDLHGVMGIHHISPYVGFPLTIVLVVFIINSINLIDGIDGLASGLASAACVIYGVFFSMCSQYIYMMVSFATLGVLMPFFYYNVFGNPSKHKKIFMGDTGSLTIGGILAFLSINMCNNIDACNGGYDYGVIAFIPLFIPCCDVVRVYFRRIRNRRNPFLPDKSHIHHKMLALRLKQPVVMVSIVVYALFLSVSNILLSPKLNINVILIGDLLLWILLNYALSYCITKRFRDNDSVDYLEKSRQMSPSANGSGDRPASLAMPGDLVQEMEKIMAYLQENEGTSEIDGIIRYSGAERQRIYPSIYRLEFEGRIVIMKTASLGAPLVVKIAEPTAGGDE